MTNPDDKYTVVARKPLVGEDGHETWSRSSLTLMPTSTH